MAPLLILPPIIFAGALIGMLNEEIEYDKKNGNNNNNNDNEDNNNNNKKNK